MREETSRALRGEKMCMAYRRKHMAYRRKWAVGRRKCLRASYTVEAAGVMAVVLFTVMILVNQALSLHAETTGGFALHEEVERERHAVEQIEELDITRQAEGRQWSLEITAPVFRPENSLRMWSLAEDLS